MDTKSPEYQKRDAAQRAKDRAAREARRVRPLVKGAAAVVSKVAPVPNLGTGTDHSASFPRAAKDKK